MYILFGLHAHTQPIYEIYAKETACNASSCNRNALSFFKREAAYCSMLYRFSLKSNRCSGRRCTGRRRVRGRRRARGRGGRRVFGRGRGGRRRVRGRKPPKGDEATRICFFYNVSLTKEEMYS